MQTTDTPIDAIQLAALRKCDSVSFHHTNDYGSYICATKRCVASATDPFARDNHVHVSCGTRWDDYARDGGISWPVPEFKAFGMIHTCSRAPEWQTIVALLRVGDVLQLHWQRDGQTTGTMRELALHGDSLRLVVARGEKTRMTFLLDISVCQDNTARMIRDVRAASQYAIA